MATANTRPQKMTYRRLAAPTLRRDPGGPGCPPSANHDCGDERDLEQADDEPEHAPILTEGLCFGASSSA